MNDSLYPIQKLIPLTQITEENIKLIRIGEDFVDLARLGMIGEYELVEATKLCPRLYYRWNYQYGKWEIYATEHDLIRYNLLGVVKLKSIVDPDDPTPGPTPPDPGPDPTPDSEPDPDDYVVDLTSSDDNWNFNGAIMTFFGTIKWYPKLQGHYVPVTFRLGNEYLQYLDSLVVTYRGAKYGKEIFHDGETTLLISVRIPGQMVPIRFDFTEELHTQYFIKIAKTAVFETPYNL